MQAIMDELRRHNRTLEENIMNIRQHQHEVNTREEVELLDPQPLLDEIWAPCPRMFQTPVIVQV